jgi:hypothetical protein
MFVWYDSACLLIGVTPSECFDPEDLLELRNLDKGVPTRDYQVDTTY